MKPIDPKLVRRQYILARRLDGGQWTLDAVFELWERYHNARGETGYKTIKRIFEKQSNGLGKRYPSKRDALKGVPKLLTYKYAPIRG